MTIKSTVNGITSFIIIIKYYVLYIIVFAILLYDRQHSRFVYLSIIANASVRHCAVTL